MDVERLMFMRDLINPDGEKLMPVPGKLLVRSKDIELIGAVGITGYLSDEGEHDAIKSIQSEDFIANSGQ